jgi:hypothetical protein
MSVTTFTPARLRSTRLADRTAAAAVAWTALVVAAFLASSVWKFDLFAGTYNASAYWVGYGEGFVRRGLPGAVLALVLGGPPGVLAATVFGVLLFALVTVALAALVGMVVRAVPGPGDRWVAAALVIASPFTFSLAVQTRGRYDTIVVACLVGITWLASRDSRRTLGLLGTALLVGVAAATEEFSFLFAAPLVLVAARRLGSTARGVLALVPGAVVVGASYLLRPRPDHLAALTQQAIDAGLPLDVAEENSISALGQSTVDALTSSAGLSPLTILVCALVLGGCFVVPGALLWARLGRPFPRAAAWFGLVLALGAVALCVAGNDYRRWWGLAFAALVCGLVLLAGGAPDPRIPRQRTSSRPVRLPWLTLPALAVAALVISAGAQLFPIYPTWDAGADTNISVEHILGE